VPQRRAQHPERAVHVRCRLSGGRYPARNRRARRPGTQPVQDRSRLFLPLGRADPGEAPRLFNIYPQGNFIEATQDTPYFQIGEAKYGKPIIDRVVNYHTPVEDAAKCALISFDSTMKSNLSVGLPIDMLVYDKDDFGPGIHQRITEHDPYFQQLHTGWGQALREAFAALPPMRWKE
jgi:putative proteasome-type protease